MNGETLIGQRFGRWIVLGNGCRKNGRRSYLCLCKCGTFSDVDATNLRVGVSQSCGCLKLEHITRHGHARTSGWSHEYQVWKNMRARTVNPKSTRFALWGGRGISICKQWLHSFEAFYEDMGPRPPGHQIDRIDNDGPYCKENCRWVTIKEQMRNTRCTVRLTFRGRTQSRMDWAEELGIDHQTIRARLRYGWSVEDALTRPVKKHNRAQR